MKIYKKIIFCVALLLILQYEAIGQMYKPAGCNNSHKIQVQGLVVSPGYIVTCYHFVEYANRDSILISIGDKQSYYATVIDSNVNQDWGLLKIKRSRMPDDAVRYGVSKNHCLDAFVIDGRGSITSSGVVKLVGGKYNYVPGKVNPSQYKTPDEGGIVMDNDGNCVGIITRMKSKECAIVMDINDIGTALSRYNVMLNKSISTDTKSQAASYAKSAVVSIDLSVNGGLYFSTFCDNYQNGTEKMDAKDYVSAMNFFTKAKSSERIPDNNDLDEKISICNYWIHRNKGDEYAAAYDLQRAKTEYNLASSSSVGYSLRNELTQRQNSLDVFEKSVSSGDHYYSAKDYNNALSEYKRAASASVRPRNGSSEMESLNGKISRTQSKLRNSQKKQFVEINAVPSWAFGLTYGIRPKKTGWYLTMLSNFNFDGMGSDLSDDGNSTPAYSYTGTESKVFMAAHTGMYFKLGDIVSLKLGLGYCIDDVYKQNTSYQWIKYTPNSTSGLSADAGLMFWVGSFSFSADVLAYGDGLSFGNISIRPQLGFGLRF